MALIHYVCWKCDHCGKQSRKYPVHHNLPKGWVPAQLVDPEHQKVRWLPNLYTTYHQFCCQQCADDYSVILQERLDVWLQGKTDR